MLFTEKFLVSLALYRKNNLKSLESVKMLRRDPETYTWMLDNIAPLIVGNGKYREECKQMIPTSWMTTSSEAFALLCLENYYENIQDIASNKSTIRKPHWTNKGLGAKRNQGWSREGLTRFAEYCKAVEKNRSNVALVKIDTNYWKGRQARIDKDEERKRKREETREKRETGWMAAHVDDWSDEEEDSNKQTTENEAAVQRSNDREEEENIDDDDDDDDDDQIH
jgi:hypothetical protein